MLKKMCIFSCVFVLMLGSVFAEEYKFMQAGIPIGGEKFTITKVKDTFELKSSFFIGNKASHQKSERLVVLDKAGKCLRFTENLTVNIQHIRAQAKNGKYKLHYVFGKKSISTNITKDGKTIWNKPIVIKKPVFCVANNFLSLFAVLCKHTMVSAPKFKVAKVFQGNLLRNMKVVFAYAGKATVQIGKKTYQTKKYKVQLGRFPIGYFYITADGKLVRNEEPRQKLVIDLIE